MSTINANVLEAIDDELKLNARIEAAKQQAIGTAVASVVMFCNTNIHSWDSAKSADIAALIAAQVNEGFERVDYVRAIKDTASLVAYRKGMNSIKIDAEQVLNDSEPEFRVILAEAALSVIGKGVAETLIAAFERAIKDRRHG